MPYSLKVKKREDKGKKNGSLRVNMKVPGVVYGPEVKENILVEIDERVLNKVYDDIGESGLIDLAIDGAAEPLEVLIKDIQFDPVSEKPIHVDFYQIKRGQKIETEADLVFINEAPAVKELGAILVKTLDSIPVRCLPKDLEKIANVEVDLTVLKEFGDFLYVKDLNLPEEIEILINPEEVIASVTEPEEEEEPEPPAEELEEGIEKIEDAEGKEETEEGKEGEEPKKEEAPAEKEADKGEKKE